uniref:Membrane glycoprotein n=1 Tax=Retropinna nidovirus TaxID=3064111 RepID=A0AA50AGD9_9NIDO|nr:MAG: membrane glycoprotein [Retropinna nidovirus]
MSNQTVLSAYGIGSDYGNSWLTFLSLVLLLLVVLYSHFGGVRSQKAVCIFLCIVALLCYPIAFSVAAIYIINWTAQPTNYGGLFFAALHILVFCALFIYYIYSSTVLYATTRSIYAFSPLARQLVGVPYKTRVVWSPRMSGYTTFSPSVIASNGVLYGPEMFVIGPGGSSDLPTELYVVTLANVHVYTVKATAPLKSSTDDAVSIYTYSTKRNRSDLNLTGNSDNGAVFIHGLD